MTEKRVKVRDPVPTGIRHGKNLTFLPRWLLQNGPFHRKVEVFLLASSTNLLRLGDRPLFSSFETWR